MADYLGDFANDDTVRWSFLTVDATGVPTTLLGTPAVTITKDGTAMTLDGGSVTLTADAGSVTGRNTVVVDMSIDDDFAAGFEYEAYLSAGTVDGVSVVGAPLARWSCENRTAVGVSIRDEAIDANTFATGVLATDADVADAVWDEPRAEHTDADSFGEGVNVYAMTTNAGASIRTAVGMASANLDSQLATIDTNVDSILVDTGTTLDTKINSILDDTGTAGVVVAAASIASIATDAAKKLGIPMTLSGTPTTTSLPVSDAPTGISTTQLDNALVLHLPSGSYSRVTEVAGSVPNLTLTVSPAYPAAPDASDEIVVFGQYLASL